MRWTGHFGVCLVVLAGSIANGQELSPEEARRVPVPRPLNVRIEKATNCLRISWDPSPLKRIVAYEVFRKTNSEEPVRVAKVSPGQDETVLTVKTAVPRQASEFYVVALDYRGDHSKPSESVIYPRRSETPPK